MMSISKKEKVIALLKSFETKRREALVWIRADRYIQHNLRLADGVDGLKSRLETLPDNVIVNIMRIFEDGDYVFTHSEYNFGQWHAGMDIFRFEDDLIVEHWDNLQAMEKPLASDAAIIGLTTELADPERTAINKQIIQNQFRDRSEKIHLVLGEGNFVLVVSEGSVKSISFAFFVLYRLDRGEVAEQWHVVEEIPAVEKRKNGNGKF